MTGMQNFPEIEFGGAEVKVISEEFFVGCKL